MSDRRGRVAVWLFAVLVAVVYGLVIAEVGRAEYSLVDDYRAFTLLHIGEARTVLWRTLVDWRAPDAWLYRPFPDTISYALAALLRDHPGVWRTIMILVRLACVGVAFAIARACTSSLVAASAAAAYFAFFPAIPELHLLRVEGWLTLVLSLVILNWIRFERGGRASPAVTAIAFVLATASKEIMAPVLLILLVLLFRFMRQRLALLTIMIVALAYQIGRCALLFTDPYSHGHASVVANAINAAKILLLAVTNFPLVPLVILGVSLLGFVGLYVTPSVSEGPGGPGGTTAPVPPLRPGPSLTLGVTCMLGALTATALVAPYPAIRYLYPVALLMVPLLAAGFDELERKTRFADAIAIGTLVCLGIFGGAQLVAQAASMRATTRADRALLETAARAMARGQDVVVLEDEDFERSFWMRAELVGVDPRWPFLSYVAQQYATHRPVVWPPPPPGGPVNLTGLVKPGGRFLMNAGDGLLIPANPMHVPPYPLASVIDFREDDALHVPLMTFRGLARRINPKFRYVYDLGEVEWPGYAWPLLRSN